MFKEYEDFWAALTPAYPVSKGSMRLPIVTELQSISELDMSAVLEELRVILQSLLADQAVVDGAKARATAAGEAQLVPLIDDSYNGVVRFDCVVDRLGGVKVLELNADYPDGLLLHDATYSVLTDTSCTLHTDAYVQFFAQECTVHISHPPEAGFLDAYYVEKAALEAAGHTVSIGATPTSDATVWHRRCIEVSKMSQTELVQWRNLKAQHLNSFALRTLGYKDLLASITHPFLPRTLAVIPAHREEIEATPAKWVLKPANGCEGQGIYFGRDYASAGWSALLADLPAGYIAQEFVELPRRMVSIYEDNEIIEKELYYDFCPHFFIQAGQVVSVGHILMRFSESSVVNVSKGGAIGYHRVV